VAHGGYVDNLGYYFAPSDYYDLALSAKAQEFNSFVFGARGRYALRYSLDGEISGRYVMDNRLENSSRQWALDYRHNQFLTPDGATRLSGRGNIISNRTFNQLYSDNTYELEKQQLDANMSLSQTFSGINASANLTWRRNHNITTDRIIEDMPSLSFSLQNRAILPYRPGGASSEPSWYNNIYYSYSAKANVRRDAYGDDYDSLPGFIRSGAEHNANLNSSQKILKYVDVSPFFNARASAFDRAIDTLAATDALTGALMRDTLPFGFYPVASWNAGVNMSTRVYGLFPTGEILGVTAIRHTLTPSAGYTFMPKHELGRTFYDVGIGYDRPRPKAQQLVNISLSNNFQGKRIVGGNDKGGGDDKADGDGGDSGDGADSSSAGRSAAPRRREQKFDILSFSLNTSYDFEAERRKWRDLSLNANTRLSILNVRHSSNFWLYDGSDELSLPIMRDYSVDLTSGDLGVSGNFWDGDLLDVDLAKPGDNPAQNRFSQKAWNLSFSPSFSYRGNRASPQDRFLPTKSFNVSSSASLNLTNSVSMRWNGNYDFSSNTFTHNNYTFHVDLECWEMRFTLRPEKINPGFHFIVNIKKIPDIKWEEKESRTTRVL
jgi:hypothetical protein